MSVGGSVVVLLVVGGLMLLANRLEDGDTEELVPRGADHDVGAPEQSEIVTASRVAIVDEPPTEGGHDGCRLRTESGEIQKAYAKLIFRGPGEADADRAALSGYLDSLQALDPRAYSRSEQLAFRRLP